MPPHGTHFKRRVNRPNRKPSSVRGLRNTLSLRRGKASALEGKEESQAVVPLLLLGPVCVRLRSRLSVYLLSKDTAQNVFGLGVLRVDVRTPFCESFLHLRPLLLCHRPDSDDFDETPNVQIAVVGIKMEDDTNQGLADGPEHCASRSSAGTVAGVDSSKDNNLLGAPAMPAGMMETCKCCSVGSRRLLVNLSFGTLAGGLGGLNITFTKSIFSLIGGEFDEHGFAAIFSSYMLWLIGVVLGGTFVFQMYSTTKGLERTPAMIFVPCQSVTEEGIAVLGGLFYFQDFKKFSIVEVILFTTGEALSIVAVFLLTHFQAERGSTIGISAEHDTKGADGKEPSKPHLVEAGASPKHAQVGLQPTIIANDDLPMPVMGAPNPLSKQPLTKAAKAQ